MGHSSEVISKSIGNPRVITSATCLHNVFSYMASKI
jgi:hypothetical protein